MDAKCITPFSLLFVFSLECVFESAFCILSNIYCIGSRLIICATHYLPQCWMCGITWPLIVQVEVKLRRRLNWIQCVTTSVWRFGKHRRLTIVNKSGVSYCLKGTGLNLNYLISLCVGWGRGGVGLVACQ